MSLINTYLYKCNRITQNTWFFFQVIIYFIVGLPQNLWPQIPTLPISENQKNILINIRTGDNTEYLYCAVPVLRNYITKSYPIVMGMRQEMRNNFLQTFFYLIGAVYKEYNTNLAKGYEANEIDLSCSCNLVIYLLETYPPELSKPVIAGIWQFIKFNLHKSKSYSLKLINAQLIAVFFWRHFD